jgi:uncharacterized protein (TIGR01777 family)
MSMKVLIFGGTGFIGRNLIPVLIKEGYKVIVFSRNIGSTSKFLNFQVEIVEWDVKTPQTILKYFHAPYSIINLAGESIGRKLWTIKQKHKILSSRLNITNAVVQAINNSDNKPRVILQGSATGYYGSSGDVIIDEYSKKGSGFLADVAEAWEKTLSLSNAKETRIVYLRTGIVLGPDGGILSKLITPFKLFAGGYFGNGKQWLPWIHISDVVNAIIFLLKNEKAKGVFNISAPKFIQMKDLAKYIGKALGRPSWFHIPAFVLKILLQEMADELLLTSQKVKPLRLLEAGFMFKFEDPEKAILDVINKKR